MSLEGAKKLSLLQFVTHPQRVILACTEDDGFLHSPGVVKVCGYGLCNFVNYGLCNFVKGIERFGRLKVLKCSDDAIEGLNLIKNPSLSVLFEEGNKQ